ncbi:MAG: hypothetical protein E4H19_12750 [Chromatiales bacterium]|nr:MAG: hypothetical protein E4H19_12750 [Chromatiales bacterium]
MYSPAKHSGERQVGQQRQTSELAGYQQKLRLAGTPPLLVTNEAPAVAALAGQYLLIVEAGVTSRSSVSKSLELLDEQKPVGLVLNKAPGYGELGSYYYAYPAQNGSA